MRALAVIAALVAAASCGPAPIATGTDAPPTNGPPLLVAGDHDAGQGPDAQAARVASAAPTPSSNPGPSAGAAASNGRAPACRGRPPLSAGSDASTALPEPSAGIDIDLSFSEGPDPQGAQKSLFLNFTTRGHFGCLGYSIPVSLRRAGDVLRATLGAVRAPQGACPTAVGPAQGSATLPPDLNGTFKLEVVRAGITDRYELAISPTRLHLKPLRTKFSWISQPSAWTRAPEGAAHLSCLFLSHGPTCQKAVAAGGPDCDKVFSDPVIAKHPPLEMQPGPYMPPGFHEQDGCNLLPTGGVPDFITYLRDKYAAAFPCLQLTVYAGQGYALLIQPLPPAAQ